MSDILQCWLFALIAAALLGLIHRVDVLEWKMKHHHDHEQKWKQ